MDNLGNRPADPELMAQKQTGWLKQIASDASKQLKRLRSSVFGESKPTKLDRSKSTAGQVLKGLRFVGKTDVDDGWSNVVNKFREITENTGGLLLRSKFGECIGMMSEDFALLLFDALARRKQSVTGNVIGDVIDMGHLREFWEQISDQSFDSRLMLFFDMMDKDHNGILTEEEVSEIIKLSSAANRLSTIQEKADEYAAMIMDTLDPNHVGYVMMEDLKNLLIEAETQSVSTVSEESEKVSNMTSEDHKPVSEPNPLKRWFRLLGFFLLDRWQRIWVIVLWITIMAILFTYKYIQYKNRAVYKVLGHCVCFAKGAAETLKLNMALILFPVCRNTITWLRNKSWLRMCVPFDDNLNFHKVIAVGITIGVGIHAVAHLACDFPRLIAATPEEYKPLGKFFGEEQAKSYSHFVKSKEGITGLVMVFLMAITFTLATPWFRRGTLQKKQPTRGTLQKKQPRRGTLQKKQPGRGTVPKKQPRICKVANFNTFWYTHHLFVIVYILLIIHGYYLYLSHEWYKKTTWMYLAVPVALYTCERLIRTFRSRNETVKVLKVASYPGNVLNLQMSRPKHFKYKSGQYMFVNCPKVSLFEWHPFSITSAPKDDYLSVHIRQLGDWTKAIKEEFTKVCKESSAKDMLDGANHPNFPTIKLDGPYGAPAQDYKKYEVVLLIGLGIGATPMISIIKDIINNTEAKEQAQSLNQMEMGSQQKPQQSKKETFKTRRAYFYWMTSEPGTYNWFKNIMNEIAERDRNQVIELHNHCTSVFEDGDVRSAFIKMIQNLYYAKNGLDIVAGTRVKTHFARPNWENVYEKIAKDHPHSNVGVFYCGSPILTKELRQLALKHTLKSTTRFSFHKENF